MRSVTMYAVFADYRFAGLFRSRVAAECWKAELETYPINYREPPCVEECDDNSTFAHRAGYLAASIARRAIENQSYGRRVL